MDTNELIKILTDRTQQLTDALDQERDRSPAAVAILEELLRDVQELQVDLLSDVEK